MACNTQCCSTESIHVLFFGCSRHIGVLINVKSGRWKELSWANSTVPKMASNLHVEYAEGSFLKLCEEGSSAADCELRDCHKRSFHFIYYSNQIVRSLLKHCCTYREFLESWFVIGITNQGDCLQIASLTTDRTIHDPSPIWSPVRSTQR